MKIIGVIPARYPSTRLPGKPLTDICGKPLVWWVYQQLSKVKEFDKVIVATDDENVMTACSEYGMNAMMTSSECKTPSDRVYEVSTKEEGDIFVFVGGDEPLVSPEAISKVIKVATSEPDFYVANAMTTITNPADIMDSSKIKMVANANGDGIYTTRSPIPYPQGSLNFEYKKFVGICAFTREALQFFADTPMSQLQKIEECSLIRFIEHHKKVKFVDVDCETLSVDTPKDLEKVREIISNSLG